MATISFQQRVSRWQRQHKSQIRDTSPPRVLREGTKKTIVANFKDLCLGMQRKRDDVMSYLLEELNTTGSLDDYQRLVVNEKLAPKIIEGILKRYADKYVICDYCKNPKTILEKEEFRFGIRFRIHCQTCGYGQCVI